MTLTRSKLLRTSTFTAMGLLLAFTSLPSSAADWPERPIKLVELLTADEVFITASNKQLMPVVSINETVIASGKPGLRTRKLMGLFGALTGEPIPGALESEHA